MRKLYAYGLLVALAPLLFFVAMFASGNTPFKSYVVLLPPAVVGVLFWTWLFRMAFRPPAVAAESPDYGPHKLMIGPDGLRDSGPAGEHMHRWVAVTSIDETEGHFFASVAEGGHYIIPKRELPSPDETSQLRLTMMEYWRAAQRAGDV